jgi:hypothetical protein
MNREVGSLEDTKPLDGLLGVHRTGRLESADIPNRWRDGEAIRS